MAAEDTQRTSVEGSEEFNPFHPQRISVAGSDEFYPFLCSPCTRKKRELGAEVYCLQCEEYFCGRCLDDHNKFAKMAIHTMFDRIEMEDKGPQNVQPMLKVSCDIHPGQMYTVYCGIHDSVCCGVCVQAHHQSCSVSSVVDVAKGVIQSSKLDDFKLGVKKAQNNLETAHNKRKTDMERLTTEKDTEIKKIHKTVETMMADLEAMKTTAINEVNKTYTEMKANIESDLTKLDTMAKTFDTKLDKLEKANNETEKFIHMKTDRDHESSAIKLIQDIEAHSREEKLVFHIDKRAEKSVRLLRSLGKLILDYQYSTTPDGQHRVDTKRDKKTCDITDICLAKNDTILITDWDNKCLKRMDKNYTVTDCLKLEDSPSCVCSVSVDQAAVTLCIPKKVQIVTLENALTNCRSFKTTGNCRGIVHHDDFLYIACGGRVEGAGHIAMHAISGALVRKFEADNQSQLFSSLPLGIAMNSTDGVMLVCDKINGLVALGLDGQKLWTVTCKDLDMSRVDRVCVDSHGQAFVSCRSSNKVTLISRDGRKLDEMLSVQDGIIKPQALCFNTQQSRLTVGMEENNQISVFKLAKPIRP